MHGTLAPRPIAQILLFGDWVRSRVWVPDTIYIYISTYPFLSCIAPPSPELRVLDNLRITKWRSVGLKLGLEDSILNCIQADHAHYPCHTQRCGLAMFSAWLDSCTSPTYTQLVEALVSAGENGAAEELSRQYGIIIIDSNCNSRPLYKELGEDT